MSVRVLAAVLAAAALGGPMLSGCSNVQEKTTGQALDEATAGTAIKTKLFTVGGFERFGEVDVEVADRLVLLSGRVPSEADKADAERIAWSVGKIEQVANELVVTQRDLARDAQDRLITERVRAHLIANRDVKGVNYNVQVFDGAVYLLGFAGSEQELRTAAEATAKIGGVKRVVSYVKVRGARAEPQVYGTTATVQPSVQEPVYEPLVGEPPARSYSDPYAPGASSPPSSGIQGSSLPPVP